MTIDDMMTKIESWLVAHNIARNRDNKQEIISGFLTINEGRNAERFIVDVRENLVIGYAICRLQKGFDRSRVVDLMARINFELLRGNFELDESEGVLRYKYVVLNHTIEYGDDDAIGEIILLPCAMMERYREYFDMVCRGEDVTKAFESAESEINDESR